ncbi:MAG: efflux RND transporter permease subunit [Pirellulaceae bacterium]
MLPNVDGKLRSETFGTGQIILREEPDAIVIPNGSSHWEGCCQVVFVRDKHYFDSPDSFKVFHVRSIRLGATNGEFTEVISGVLPGEVIAAAGSDVLRAVTKEQSWCRLRLRRRIKESTDAKLANRRITALIDALVILTAALFAVVGVFSLQQLDIDAFPDTTPVQIQINTVAPSLASEEIERQITFPVEQAISGLPGLHELRSISKFGLSQVVVIFDDGIDIYFARQLINERLSTVELPDGISRPQMGPVSTGLGEVFHYVLVYDGVDFSEASHAERVKRMTELRTIHDWVVKPQLRSVRGVAEVNSWGGYEKQYQIRLDPEGLFKYGLTFEQVSDAIETNNENVGGGTVTDGSEMLLVHGIGRTVNIKEIEDIVITSKDGVPVRIRDVADVMIGHEIRRGAVTANGRGEAVLGLGFMLMGENIHDVTWAIKKRSKVFRNHSLLASRFKRSMTVPSLIDHVIHTVQKNLFEGGLLVVAVLFIFLGNLRAGIIVAARNSAVDAVRVLRNAEVRHRCQLA